MGGVLDHGCTRTSLLRPGTSVLLWLGAEDPLTLLL